jgi:protease II
MDAGHGGASGRFEAIKGISKGIQFFVRFRTN